MISDNANLGPLDHALPSREGPFHVFNTFIRFFISTLWFFLLRRFHIYFSLEPVWNLIFIQERILINAVWKNDFLPQEIKDFAYQDIQKHPRDSTVLRINRRCAVTGRARGIFHQFRVSRFVFRHNADYNKISGAQYAHWFKGIDLKP